MKFNAVVKTSTNLSSDPADMLVQCLRLVGCTCVGQDYQARSSNFKQIFCGHAGNNYTSEAVLLTGCIDLVVSEFNCTIPGLEPICKELDIDMICLDDVAKKANARLMPYSAESKDAVTGEILSAALVGFKNRNQKVCPSCSTSGTLRVNPMANHGYDASITGLSEDTLVEALGGSLKPLIDTIAPSEYDSVLGAASGAGQPNCGVTPVPDSVRKNRIDSLYAADERSTVRLSINNPEIVDIYADFLKEPLSPLSELLLHTTYNDK